MAGEILSLIVWSVVVAVMVAVARLLSRTLRCKDCPMRDECGKRSEAGEKPPCENGDNNCSGMGLSLR